MKIKLSYFETLSAAGFSATAIAFGPARMGFGLFVPEFQSAFELNSTTIGIVSSLGFAGFLVGLLLAEALLLRQGPKAPVVAGLLAAVSGMGLIAGAWGVINLAIGVFLAASSAGLCWTPFNDAVNRKVGKDWKPNALSRISTGTSLGIAGAGLVALIIVFAGLSWRICWMFFTVIAVAGVALNWRALDPVEMGQNTLPEGLLAWMTARRVWPLYVIGLTFGITSAIFISFAAGFATDQGGVPGVPKQATPALIYIIYGAVGLLGLLTSRLKVLLGLTWLMRALMLAGALSLLVLALAPDRWSGLMVAAGLQGAQVMMVSAVLSFWSEELFPDVPATGFTGAVVAMAIGSVLGPAIAGVAASAFGTPAMLMATAAVSALVGLGFRKQHAREDAVATPRQ